MMSVEAAEAIYRVAIAEDPPETLEAFGVVVEGRDGARILSVPSGLPAVQITFQELALGFVRHWALGTRLSEWAALVLMFDNLELPEDRSSEEEAFMGTLWDASAGEPITDAAVQVARRLSCTKS